LIMKKIIELKFLIRTAIDISVFSLIISLVLCYKDIKEAIIRRQITPPIKKVGT